MTLVAWEVPNHPGWVGGLNYFVNLAKALFSLPHRQVEPVLLGEGTQLPPPLNSLPCVPYPVLSARGYGASRLFDAARRRLLHDGGMLARQLRQHDIQLLSHGQILGKRSPVPAMCWIPDFQHRHLPNFFTPEDRIARDRVQASIARNAQAVVLSSEHARSDYLRLFPHRAAPSYVLPFVAATPTEELPASEAVLPRHGINEPYFHVPNQLWAHKNHHIVCDALRVLASRGHCPLVVSTGQTQDYRNPTFFNDLTARVRDLGLSERFRFLGLLPYAEVTTIMSNAVALINPSLFEGWSTTVEEAKSLGKHLLLSDIAVHREQAPERCTYFAPDDAEGLAAAMQEALRKHDIQTEQAEMKRAAELLPKRMQAYAHAYEAIVLQVIKNNLSQR